MRHSPLTHERIDGELFFYPISDELDYLPVLVSLPPQQTIFEYLVGCWKRLNVVRSTVIKKVKGFEECMRCAHSHILTLHRDIRQSTHRMPLIAWRRYVNY